MSKNLLASLLALACLCGCGAPAAKPKAETKTAEHAHEHAEEGPHKGQLIELGKEEYHAELVLDEVAHVTTVYLLDSSAKKAAPSTAKELTINLVIDGKPQQFQLAAAPEATEKSGESSRYESTDEALCHALEKKEVKGRLNVTVGDKDFSGELKGHDHEHDHDHKH